MSDAATLAALLRPAIASARVLAAIGGLPRDRFVPESERERAYDNVALPIACGQTISQPLVVARMLELLDLRCTDRVLDIGTGSGYHAALLAMLSDHVWTIERHRELSRLAERTLAELGIANVTCLVGDGCEGLSDRAPFDAINVAAAGAAVPSALVQQLAVKGRLVAPIGVDGQRLTLTRRTRAGLRRAALDAVRFVPLVQDP